MAAADIKLVGDHGPQDVAAAQDLRAFQYRAVQFGSVGVKLSGTDATSGPAHILFNAPNSGRACTFVSPPNHTKAYAGIAIIRNQDIVIGTSGGFCNPGSNTSPMYIGTAITAAASGSMFTLAVRR